MAKYINRGIRPRLPTELKANKALISLFFREGWDYITYRRIAAEAGLSVGAIQAAIKTKEMMRAIVSGLSVNYIIDELALVEDADIEEEWFEALNGIQFRRCVEFLLIGVVGTPREKAVTLRCLNELAEVVGKADLHRILGESAFIMVGGAR